ncbi:hypothetical protein CMV_014573 [Castanea mollissima]|uniref:Uncharacterized protein n=1 Tax=Castanea mollissima TaxID=60419 RepID=A0A8J4RBW1_9ROSI|nr:hypothetical protein CMV_014573 [Castanea mollissima]
MLPYELCHRILIALKAAVGWFREGMLCHQNNEMPSLSCSYAPTISDSINLQSNAIQAASANNSVFNQNPISGQVTRSYAAQHPARQGNFESSPMT